MRWEKFERRGRIERRRGERGRKIGKKFKFNRKEKEDDKDEEEQSKRKKEREKFEDPRKVKGRKRGKIEGEIYREKKDRTRKREKENNW